MSADFSIFMNVRQQLLSFFSFSVPFGRILKKGSDRFIKVFLNAFSKVSLNIFSEKSLGIRVLNRANSARDLFMKVLLFSSYFFLHLE